MHLLFIAATSAGTAEAPPPPPPPLEPVVRPLTRVVPARKASARKRVRLRTLGREEFRVRLRRGRRPASNIDRFVEGFSWTDDGPVVTGTLQFRQPEEGPKKDPIGVSRGDRIYLEYSPDGRGPWKDVPGGPFRVQDPSVTLPDGAVSVEFSNDLQRLSESKTSWRFVEDKAHPKGWRTDEIVKFAARRFGLRVAPLPRMKHRVRRLIRKSASPLEIIALAFRFERRDTGRRFFLGLRNGKLVAWPYRRSREVTVFGPLILQATYAERFRDDFATELNVRASGKGKAKKRKISVRVVSKAAQRRYGRVVRDYHPHDVKTEAEARKAGQRSLARRAKPRKELTLTHPGMIGIGRGDAVRLTLEPELGLKQVVFVRGVTHVVGPGEYTVEPTIAWDDPYVDKKAEREEEKKKKKRKRRGIHDEPTPPPIPKNRKVRDDS